MRNLTGAVKGGENEYNFMDIANTSLHKIPVRGLFAWDSTK
jgi:hypothetical protein